MYFQPSTPQHLARPNEAEKAWYEKPLWQTFSDWWNTPSTPAGPPPKPPTADGTPVAKGTTAYAAILAELEKKYGKFPANATGYRDAVGNGNYVYRQYSDGRIFIQKSGQGSAPVAPKVVDAKSVPTTGGGLPPWVLPVSVVGGAALIGVGVFIFVKRKGKR
jgi:hypothetical protein